MDDLLPANRTGLEAALSESLGPRLVDRPLGIRGLKLDPAEPLLPWLIWEYGLGELRPWLADPRRAIAEGVLWQRLRGTPAALATALGWIGVAGAVEEEGPGSGYALFQLGLDAAPDTDAVQAIVQLATLSAPARARLARLYNSEWDRRRFEASHSDWGDLLGDWSGVPAWDQGPRLSFGRRHAAASRLDLPAAPLARVHGIRTGAAWATALDRFLLDVHRLGEDPWHRLNPAVSGGRTLVAATTDRSLASPTSLVPRRVFARACVVLSDSDPLGDTNATFNPRRRIETGRALRLDDDRLGDLIWRIAFEPIDERIERGTGSGASWAGLVPTPVGARRWTGMLVPDRADWPVFGEHDVRPGPAAGHFDLYGVTVAWPGAAWPVGHWPALRWSELLSPAASLTHASIARSADRLDGFSAALAMVLVIQHHGRVRTILLDGRGPSPARSGLRQHHAGLDHALDDRRWFRGRWQAAPWGVPSAPTATRSADRWSGYPIAGSPTRIDGHHSRLLPVAADAGAHVPDRATLRQHHAALASALDDRHWPRRRWPAAPWTAPAAPAAASLATSLAA